MTNNNATEQRTEGRKESLIEIVVGYDGYYNFEIGNDQSRRVEEMFSTSSWNASTFYEAGQIAAGWLHKRGNLAYNIVNGATYEIKYEIPEEEAIAWSRNRADDPFWSGGEPPAHFERKQCRELLPEQLEMFKSGLEYQLRVLVGESQPVAQVERLDENPLLPEVLANRYATQLGMHNYSEDIITDSNIKKRKLIEAMIMGKLDLSGERAIG